MKSIAKFLLVVLGFAPIVVHAAPVSQTAGSNLTGYNGAMGSVAGNQWNNATNPRQNTQNTTAKADFGNCNSLILRCAKPKCSGGGCSSMDVAKPIVTGCVNSNSTCKKHGSALIDSLAAQLVSDSVAAANAQAAAAAAAQNSADQNAQAMQQQMAQMQQQMAQMQQQSNAQIASLQNALEESQRATNNAVQQAATAAANAAAESAAANASVLSPTQTLTAAEVEAVKSGINPDVVERGKITGQVLTSMQGVDESLDKLKTVMREAFKYGNCNEINGDNCAGPKRVAKFRDLAKKFFEPYEALSDNLEDALLKAQSAGIDLGNIYMFFSGACNRWGEYVCRYTNVKSTQIVFERICALTGAVDAAELLMTSNSTNLTDCSTNPASYRLIKRLNGAQICTVKSTVDNLQPQDNTQCAKGASGYEFVDKQIDQEVTSGLPAYDINTCNTSGTKAGTSKNVPGLTKGGYNCSVGQVIPPEDLVGCIMNKTLDATDNEVQEKILNPDITSSGTIRVGCAPDLGTSLIKRRRSSKKASGIDIDLLEMLVNQSEGSLKFKDVNINKNDSPTQTGCVDKYDNTNKIWEVKYPVASCFCATPEGKVDDVITQLKSAIATKSLGQTCCNGVGPNNCKVNCYDLETDVSYVHPKFALCDTHAWNGGYETNDDALAKAETKSKMKEVIGLKTTIITQQMYKQYSTLATMIKQLKVMLEKAALKAELQVASETNDDDDSGPSVQFATCSRVDKEAALTCLRDNYSKLQPFVSKGNNRSDVKKQLENDAGVLTVLLTSQDYKNACDRPSGKQKMQQCLDKIAEGINKLNDEIRKSKNNNGGGIVITGLGGGGN